MIETIDASRCPACRTIVAPPASYCPHHPVAMEPVSLPGAGERQVEGSVALAHSIGGLATNNFVTILESER